MGFVGRLHGFALLSASNKATEATTIRIPDLFIGANPHLSILFCRMSRRAPCRSVYLLSHVRASAIHPGTAPRRGLEVAAGGRDDIGHVDAGRIDPTATISASGKSGPLALSA